MKVHHGMRPHDIVILFKVLTINNMEWRLGDLGSSLFISNSEIYESLNRSHIAGLLDETKRLVHRQSLMEFVQYGLHYVFPQVPGTMVTGMPTAHSHPFYEGRFINEYPYVWPDDAGGKRGLSIQPLYKTVCKAARLDEGLYFLLASVDIIRVGRVREIKLAIEELKSRIL
jgi:hypothetical protein